MNSDKNKKKLQDIFDDDDAGLLETKPKVVYSRNEDERLLSTFQEIEAFYQTHGREPGPGGGISEWTLFSRLKGLRENEAKRQALTVHDTHGLLKGESGKEAHSIEDILADDSFGLLNTEADTLFEYKHIQREDERAKADFVARRKPCKDFAKYEEQFKTVQRDLKEGVRKLVTFRQDNLREGDFYVHNGVLLLLEKVDWEEEVQEFNSGSRVRKDGRTRVVFENGTESNMLYRSLYKALLSNGKAVSENAEAVNEAFIEKFSSVTDEDKEAGYIYVLKSKSTRPEINSITNLYKIGYSTSAVEDRIKNAADEPTYLMADVTIITAFKCYNMNPQKLEQLLHNFFGTSCLNVDVFDRSGQRYTPREWFIAPLAVIEEAIQLILSGNVVNHKYDAAENEIVQR